MCTKFQVDWTSTSSKTTFTKNFNLKGLDARTDERMDEQRHRPENIMPLYYVGENKEKCLFGPFLTPNSLTVRTKTPKINPNLPFMVINLVFKFHEFLFTCTKVRVRKPNVFGRRRCHNFQSYKK